MNDMKMILPFEIQKLFCRITFMKHDSQIDITVLKVTHLKCIKLIDEQLQIIFSYKQKSSVFDCRKNVVFSTTFHRGYF